MKKEEIIEKIVEQLFLILLLFSFGNVQKSFAMENSTTKYIGNLTQKEAFQHFKAIKKIVDILWKLIEQAQEEKLIGCCEGWRKARLDPKFFQTQQGLVLEIYSGIPLRLWTPWGEVRLLGKFGGDWTTVITGLFNHLKLEPHLPTESTYCGIVSQAYKIMAIDGNQLPDQIDFEKYWAWEDAKLGTLLEKWKEMESLVKESK